MASGLIVRQQLLATMVMMGINRLVVTKGNIPARVESKESKDHEDEQDRRTR